MRQASTDEGGGLLALYRALWRYAEGERHRVLAFMALLVGSQLVRLSIPLFTGAAVTALQGGDLAGAGRDMAFIFAAALVAWAMHGPGRTMERQMGLSLRER